MQAVVPAAGRGSRLRPLTDDRPKGLVEVGGAPILTHCFETLADLGVEEVVVVVGYRGDDVVDYYGDHYGGVEVTYARQPERLGLADAVLSAAEHVDDEFLLLHGDNLFGADLEPVVRRHREADPAATLLVDRVDPETARTVGVCDFEDGEFAGVVEKPDDPPSRTVLRGFSRLSDLVFPACRLLRPSERGEYELADALSLLASAGHDVELVYADDWVCNVNTHADLDRARQLLDG